MILLEVIFWKKKSLKCSDNFSQKLFLLSTVKLGIALLSKQSLKLFYIEINKIC